MRKREEVRITPEASGWGHRAMLSPEMGSPENQVCGRKEWPAWGMLRGESLKDILVEVSGKKLEIRFSAQQTHTRVWREGRKEAEKWRCTGSCFHQHGHACPFSSALESFLLLPVTPLNNELRAGTVSPHICNSVLSPEPSTGPKGA